MASRRHGGHIGADAGKRSTGPAPA